jgi:predicted double-glycine peptidase
VAEVVATEVMPTATIPPTATAEPTATPAPLHQLAAPAGQLAGVRHEYQGWNNCGPTTLAMLLSFFGRSETQQDTAPFLKPNREDKNVSPNEMASYGTSIGYSARVVIGMDVPMLKTLLTNQIPVIVETWYIPEPEDEMGHYLLFTGYTGETLSFYDSYKGPNVTKEAATFDALWKVFNRTAILVYPPEQEALVNSILGELADPAAQIERATQIAYAEATANPQDKFAWFNLGSSLTMAGDTANAVQAFDTARSLKLPWRMMWYQFGPYEAYYAQGRYDEVIALSNATLANADNLEESFYWRGRAQAALGNADAARSDYETALRLNSNFAPARQELGG